MIWVKDECGLKLESKSEKMTHFPDLRKTYDVQDR